MQKPSMMVGQKGVKYGLHVRQPKQQEQPKQNTGRLAAFSADSDSEEDVGAQVARQAARKVADSKVQEMYAAALAEDPNAFDYDGVYDSIQQEKAAPKAQDKVARQPKYIANLLEQAQQRKREQDITNERRLLKERQKEDHEYGDSEKFITSAYRKKLEEDKKWQESQALKDLEEERNDVTKLGHMNNFFHNLTRNVALGGTGASAAPQKQRSTAAEAEEAAAEAEAADRSDLVAGAEAASSEQQLKEQQLKQSQPTRSGDSGNEQQQATHMQQQGERQGNAGDGEEPASRQSAAAAETQRQQQQPSREQAAAAGNSQAAADANQQQQTAAASGKRKNDDVSVAAARERYLARKRQQMGA